MIQVLFTLVFVEMGVILALMFGTPIRKVLIMGLDKAKQGRGPLVAKTVAGTLFVVFISSLYSVMEIQKRSIDSGSVNPTDQVLLANHRLEASLIGFSLFLGLIIDRLHYYIKELKLLRTSLEAVKKQHLGYNVGKDETQVLEELELDHGTKFTEANTGVTKADLKGKIKKI